MAVSKATTRMNTLEQLPRFPVVVSNPYARAQELNENAAAFASIGHYDRAITELTRALEVWKRCRTEDDAVYICVCPRCNSQEGCCSMQTDEKEISDSTITSSSATTTSAKNELLFQDNTSVSSTTEDINPIGFEHGYMHQEMIRIPCREHFDFQNVSSGVALIIIFNLAIVHHRNALRHNCKSKMAKTLRLYQLVNECLNNFCLDTHQACCSKASAFDMGTMIQMVLANNLGHLHSCLGNSPMRNHCAEQLIPILMCVIDDRVLRNSQSEMIGEQEGLEGFVQTICPLVLTSQCADAA